MQPEIEAKFVDVDIEAIRSRLRAAGAVLEHPMRDMRRALIEEEHHKAEGSFIRIRDEGDKTTLTFKRRVLPDHKTTIDSVHELETTVGDFDTAINIFKEAGWNYVTYQESRRETWQLGDAEVVIDEWPWLQPMVEIEASSEEVVRATAGRLGFDWDQAVFGSVDVVYRRDYPDMAVRGVIEVKEVRFADPVPAAFLPEGER